MQKNIEQKLNGFKSSIFESIEKMLVDERAKIDKQESAELKSKGDDIRAEAESFKKSRTLQTDDNVRKMLSDAKLEQNAKALKLRKYMLDSTYEALYDKAKSFTESEAYQARIKASIDKIADDLRLTQSLSVAVNDTDKTWVVPYIKTYFNGDITTEKLKKRDIGGVIISLDDAYIRYNMSLKRMIDDSKEDIGTVLFTLLEKMEGNDDE